MYQSLTFTIPGRYLAETDNVSEPFKQSDDTVRIDPLENFKKYRGGYDITNKNYWSVSLYTSLPSSHPNHERRKT